MYGLNWKWIFSILKSENKRAENNLEDTIVAYVMPEKTSASDKQKIGILQLFLTTNYDCFALNESATKQATRIEKVPT